MPTKFAAKNSTNSQPDRSSDFEELDAMNLNELKAERARRSFYAFFKEFWNEQTGDPLEDTPHIKYLCGVAQKVGMKIINGEDYDMGLLINCSPSVSKSTILSVMLNCWLWIHNPSIKIITASSTMKLAEQNMKKTLLVLNSDKYKIYFPWVELGNTQNIREFSTTKNGLRFACSSGSEVRGVHGILLIADDIDSNESVSSETEREKLQDWITGTFLTRKTNAAKAQVIFVQQRLGSNDSSKFLLDTGNYEHICLPAIYSEATVKPASAKALYNEDGLLVPGRLSRKVLEAKRKEMIVPGAFNAQFLQNPAGEGDDGIIHKGWIPVITRYEFDKMVNNKHYVVDFYCDPAFTTNKKRTDPSAIIACATIEGVMYITNVGRVWLETPELIKFIKNFAMSNGYSPRSTIMCEPKGPGQALIPLLKGQLGLNVVAGIAYNKKHGDKAYRLSAVTPKVQEGKVKLVEGAYVRSFLDELTVLDSRHDDQKDVFSMAVNDALLKPKGYGKLNFR